jgi:lipopolysaccharide transport system permease protein
MSKTLGAPRGSACFRHGVVVDLSSRLALLLTGECGPAPDFRLGQMPAQERRQMTTETAANGTAMIDVNQTRFWRDLVRYRDLLFNLVGSDLRSRYRRSFFGVLWAMLQPLGFAGAIGLVWANVYGLPFKEFMVVVLGGLIVFELFSQTLNTSLHALTNAQGYLQQQRIPLFIFQMRPVISALINFGFGFLSFLIVVALTGAMQLTSLSAGFVAMLAMSVLFLIPLAMIFSVLGTLYRDVVHIAGLATSALLLISPVFLRFENLSNAALLHVITLCNPVALMIHMFRDTMHYGVGLDMIEVAAFGCWIVGAWIVALVLMKNVGRDIIHKL